jgi:TPR repeat protein
MSDINTGKEPDWLTSWRKGYKKSKLRPDESLDQYNYDNKPFDFEKFKRHAEAEFLKGNIPDNIAKQILEGAKERDGTMAEVPVYEDPSVYPFFRKWSEKLNMAIPRVLHLKDDNGKEADLTLDHPPCIITRRMGELNAGCGRIDYPDDTYCYVEFDTLFFYFVNRIATVGSRLFDMKSKVELGNIKKLVDINLERDPDIHKYFRDAFYHFMFYGNVDSNDENMRMMFGVEIFTKLTGFLPPPDIKANLFFSIESVIRDSMGLFIMGHEYAHIVLHLIGKSGSDYNNPVAQLYQREYQADDLALMLTWNCLMHENNQTPEEKALAKSCFIGVEIAFNCLYIIDRMRGILNGNQDAIVYSDHPPTRKRMESIRQSMQRLWKEWGIDSRDVDFLANFLDAVDYIFQKMADGFIDEMKNNAYFKKYYETKKKKDAGLVSEVLDLIRVKALNTNTPTQDLDNEIIRKSKEVLSYDPNNIQILFALGATYLENYKDGEAVECFMRIISITAEDVDNNRPFDHLRFYASMYYVGYCYTQKVVSILQKSNSQPDSDQEKKITSLLDESITFFETAAPHYNHDGMAFHYLGVALSFKNDHQKAIENFQKALQYQPNNPQILLALQSSYSKLAGIPNLSSVNFDMSDDINAAEKGDPQAQRKLGIYYENGLGVPVDLEKAVYWFNEAAKNGDAEAQYFLGNYYKSGRIVKQDIKEAVVLYTMAAEQGYIYAQYDLGVLYINGIENVVDLKKAFYWFFKAAEQGDAPAQYNVGVFYENGYVEPKDLTKAVYWYTNAAQKGYVNAQYNLGLLLYKAGNTEAAVNWLQKATDHGDLQAKKMLANIHT